MVDSEWLSRDAPVEFCAWHHDGYIAWPAEYRQWAGASVVRRSSLVVRRDESFRITNPAGDSTYFIDPTLRGEFQALRLRANGDAKWSVDGKPAAREWPLAPGTHVIAAVDGRGRRDEVRITVR